MAFYTGSANSFADLQAALVNACVAEGWVWADGILSKGAAYVRPYVSLTTTTTEGLGLVIQGGTGQAAGALVGASPSRPRLGLPSSPGAVPAITWPVAYDIHVHPNPDEVFCIIRTSVDRYFWLAFGVSAVSGIGGTGLWLAATSYRASASGTASFSIQPNFGMSHYWNGGEVSPGLFWTTGGNGEAGYISETIHTGISAGGWNARPGNYDEGLDSFNAIQAAAPHIQRTPNAWNQEAPFIPIQGYLWRASSKVSLVVDVGAARYVRLDNYEPEQIITLGGDRWKVYPFYRKKISARDGGAAIDHSGTFGWAIRYDGP